MSQTPLPRHWYMGQGLEEPEQRALDCSDDAETVVQTKSVGFSANKRAGKTVLDDQSVLELRWLYEFSSG